MLRPLILILFSSAAYADTYVSDAFGIVPEAELSEERASWAGLRTGSTEVVVPAKEPAATLLFIGGKSLVAGKDEGHAVALSLDAHGNLVQDAVATFSLETNDNQTAPTVDGLAGLLFSPAPTSGTFSGGASVGAVQSARALYRVVADLENVQPSMQLPAPLQTEAFAVLTTDDLTDQFGNPVEDGVGTTLQIQHVGGGTTQLSAPVRETRAETVLLVRDMAEGGDLTAFLGANSGTSNVDIEPLSAFGRTQMTAWKDDDLNAIALRVGPVMTSARHLLNDGSPITVTVVAGEEQATRSGWLLDGYFETTLPLADADGSLEVTVSTALQRETVSLAISDKPEIIRGAE